MGKVARCGCKGSSSGHQQTHRQQTRQQLTRVLLEGREGSVRLTHAPRGHDDPERRDDGTMGESRVIVTLEGGRETAK